MVGSAVAMQPSAFSAVGFDRIGPYRLGAALGEGGMGVVYRAIDERTGEAVALKIVRVVDESLLASFRREIFALRSIAHPSVVQIVDDGVEGSQPWYAMALLEGRTLADLIHAEHAGDHTVAIASAAGLALGQGVATVGFSPEHAMADTMVPPPPSKPAESQPRPVAFLPEALKMMERLCGALAFLHGEGLVHRDVKPDNIFIRRDGLPVLVDFGLALRQGGAHATRDVLDVAGRALGTPPYMAPEQIRGDLVDARADLYALGCVLYEFFTGTVPFSGSATAVLTKHLREKAPAPRDMGVDIPVELDRLIMRLLEKEPRHRLGYAADVARILRQLGAPQGPQAQLPPARPYLYRPRLAGRSGLMRQLQEILGVRAGGACVLLSGESGSGKTRLAAELGTWAARGRFRIVTGECADMGGAASSPRAAPLHPFLPLLLAIADRCRAHGIAETDRLLGERGPILTPYEPSFAMLPGQRRFAPPALLPAEAARERLLKALTETIRAFVGERPLLLVLDDLQWGDEISLALLERLDSKYLKGLPLFVVGTYRSEEQSAELKHQEAQDHVTGFQLEALQCEAVRQMVGDMLALEAPPAPLVAFLMEDSDGNPFFIAEYLRVAIDEQLLLRAADGRWSLATRALDLPSLRQALPLPGGLRDLARRRFSRLDEHVQRLSELAAVLGREFDGELLLRATTLDSQRARGALEQLRARQVLEEGVGGQLRFIHDKLREVIYAHIPEAEQSVLHGVVAAAIERGPAPAALGPADCQRLAHHYHLAHNFSKTMEYSERAGEHALASAAFNDARAHFQRALVSAEERSRKGGPAVDAVQMACWRRRMAEANYNVGRLQDARAQLRQSFEALAPKLPMTGPPKFTEISSSLVALAGQVAGFFGRRPHEAHSVSERQQYREAALAAERLAQVHFFLVEQRASVAMALQCARCAEHVGPSPELARAYAVLSVAAGYVPARALSRRYGERAAEIADVVADPHASAFVSFLRGLNAVGAGEHQRAVELLEPALDTARHNGDVRAVQEALGVLAQAHNSAGALTAFEACTDELLAVAQRTHNQQGVLWAIGGKSQVLTGLGRAAEAVSLREEHKALVAADQDLTTRLEACHVAIPYLMLGAWQQALSAADEALALGAARPTGWHVCAGYFGACEAFLAAWERAEHDADGRFERSAREACRQLARASRIFRFARPAELLYAGSCQWLRGRGWLARRLWARSLQLGIALEQPASVARAHLELGRHLPEGSQRREHLSSAAAGYRRIGAHYWATHAQAGHPYWDHSGVR